MIMVSDRDSGSSVRVILTERMQFLGLTRDPMWKDDDFTMIPFHRLDLMHIPD